ncbi:hypothetical protein PPGU19_016480 [Paraburkholderia sp. PGU19]|nr:hypothetical protein PPGU19_016480 [Paraburkholderia sp. PGU19]
MAIRSTEAWAAGAAASAASEAMAPIMVRVKSDERSTGMFLEKEPCDEGGAGRVGRKKAVWRPDARLLTFCFRGPILRDTYVQIVTMRRRGARYVRKRTFA